LAAVAFALRGLPDAAGIKAGHAGQDGNAVDGEGFERVAAFVKKALQLFNHLRIGLAAGDFEQIRAIRRREGGQGRAGVECVQHVIFDDVAGRFVAVARADMRRRQGVICRR
jgi:hypothetical protein